MHHSRSHRANATKAAKIANVADKGTNAAIAITLTIRAAFAHLGRSCGLSVTSPPHPLRILHSLRGHVLFDVKQLIHVEEVIDIVDRPQLMARGQGRV
jgi:hypothetical protein